MYNSQTSKLLVSFRGDQLRPVLGIVEWNPFTLKKVIEIEIPNFDVRNIPPTKRGFTGITVHEGQLVGALWDRIVFMDPQSFEVTDSIYDPNFSDLHGIAIDSGNLWISNTNLDSIYKVDLRTRQVENVWEGFRLHAKGKHLPEVDRLQDFGKYTKEYSDYHHFHFNSVYIDSQYIYCSYLGTPPNVFINKRVTRKLQRTGLMKQRSGGIVVLDRNSLTIVKNISTEGLHDPFEYDETRLAFPCYFTNQMIILNRQNLSTTKLSLQMDKQIGQEYLGRGGIRIGDEMLVCHTVNRKAYHLPALIRKYTLSGKYTGEQIEIENFKGPYDIIQFPK